jgi:4-amino-4-deoxy-L-arabinose transferase-like glycosyltransferase
MKKLAAWLKNPSYLLMVIMGLSVLARLAGAVDMGDSVEELPGTFDQISYHLLAQRVLGGYGFSFGQDWWPLTAAGEPTAHWSFLYTFYLVLVYAVFGVHPLAARIIQALIFGLLQPYLTYRIGNRLFGKWVGLVSALLAAGYAYFIYYGGTLMTEPFYILAILWVFDSCIGLVTQPETEKSLRGWFLLGIGMGLAVLLRQVFLLMIPIILLWMAWALYRRQPSFRFVRFVVPLLVVAVMIVPFTIYNTARFGRAVLLNTNAGFAFFWGNHPYYGTDFQPILPDGMYQELIPQELRGLDEAALDQALLGRAMENILDNPVRYVKLSISRIPDFFMFWPSPDSGRISNVSRVASFGILWPFMLAGLIVSWWKAGRTLLKRLDSPITLLVLFITAYSVLHIMTWTLIRYRLPIDAVALPFAGYAMVLIDRRWLHIGQRLFGFDEASKLMQAVEV